MSLKMNIKDVVFPSELSTERIVLRKLRDEDKQAIYDIYSHEESAKLDDWVPFGTIEDAIAFIDQSHKKFYDKSELQFGIEDLSRRSLVGCCGVFGFDDCHKKCLLSYQVHHGERNKGYATDAIMLLVRYVFTELGANRIEAYVTPGNTASLRVLEKNGFKQEGVLREMEYYKDRFWDGIVMGMIRRDFNKIVPD